MGAAVAVRRVIGSQGHDDAAVRQRPERLVQPFEKITLGGGLAVMRADVGSLDVDECEIAVGQRPEGGADLAGQVGVQGRGKCRPLHRFPPQHP